MDVFRGGRRFASLDQALGRHLNGKIESIEVEEVEQERRREYRLNRVMGAELLQGQEVVKARLYIINLSRGGMKATHHSRLPDEEMQGVRLYLLPKEAPLELKVRVAWQKELTLSGMFEIGFQFLDLPEEVQERIESFIESERKKVEPAQKTLDLSSPWKFGRAD